MSVVLMTIATVVNSASQPRVSGYKLQERWLISVEDLGFRPPLLSILGQPFHLSGTNFLCMKAESTLVLVLCEFLEQPE